MIKNLVQLPKDHYKLSFTVWICVYLCYLWAVLGG